MIFLLGGPRFEVMPRRTPNPDRHGNLIDEFCLGYYPAPELLRNPVETKRPTDKPTKNKPREKDIYPP